MKSHLPLMLLMVVTVISGCMSMTASTFDTVTTGSAASMPENKSAPRGEDKEEGYPLAPPTVGSVATVAAQSDTSARDSNRYWTVRTYFATSRNREGRDEAGDTFGNKPAEISYGICDVTVPKSHKIGEDERPSIWRLEFQENPDEHLTVRNVKILDRTNFYSQLATKIKSSSRQSVLIFVHGYNVTFESAARRTAQIAKDLEFEGAPIFYSWPSAGSVMAYRRDMQTSERTRPELKSFIMDILNRSEFENVFIIAHSMGAWAVTPVLAEVLKEHSSARERIKEVILAAPDIDADVFKRQIAPAFVAAGEPVTLYASSNDYALVASRVFNGFPRLGDSGKGLVIMPGIETIDASEVPTEFLGHSYVGNARSLIADIYYIIGDRLRADQRAGLRRAGDVSEGTTHWVFKK